MTTTPPPPVWKKPSFRIVRFDFRPPDEGPPLDHWTKPSFTIRAWTPNIMKIKSYDSTRNDSTPTTVLYEGLLQAFAVFNKQLFDGGLPDVLITIVRKGNTRGYYRPAAFDGKDQDKQLAEIALNPVHFVRSDEATLATLAHEMVHHWQHTTSSPSVGYHDREWGAKMEEIGLMPSSTGEPGGKKTGSKVSHYIMDGGPFQSVAKAVIESGFKIDWAAFDTDGPSKAKDKIKYTCPSCNANIWGKPGILAICQPCSEVFAAEATAATWLNNLPKPTPPAPPPTPKKPSAEHERWLSKHRIALAIPKFQWTDQPGDKQRAELVLEQYQKISNHTDLAELGMTRETLESAYSALQSGELYPPMVKLNRTKKKSMRKSEKRAA